MSLLVFKIMKPSASFHGIAYNDKKCKEQTASLLYYNHFRHLQEAGRIPSKAEAIRFMETFCSGNTRIRNKQFHAILSCKGTFISNERLKTYGLEIMQKMGYGHNPVMIYGHNDTKHNHIHIVTTRIGPDGKKIPHHFERKRSCEILQQIIGTDYKKEVAQHINDVLQYHCSSVAQYQLLFELRGYDTRSIGDQLELFKYGTKQENVPLARLQQKMKQVAAVNPDRAKALLYKYKKQHSSKLEKENHQKYTSAKPRLQSELTEFMKQRFGMEFIFFTSKGHEAPYGYVIIDHANKAVLKGSEVMRLDELISEKPLTQKQAYEQGNKKLQITDDPDLNNPNFDRDLLQKRKYIPEIGLENTIERIEADVEKDLSKEHDLPRRRRGRFI